MNKPDINIAEIELKPRPTGFEFPAGAEGKPGIFRAVGRERQGADYWESE